MENTEEKLSWAYEMPNVPGLEARTCLWSNAPAAVCDQGKTVSLAGLKAGSYLFPVCPRDRALKGLLCKTYFDRLLSFLAVVI